MMICSSAVGAHLWQSTLFALVIGLAALMLRRNHAAIRHALWMVASFKFLVPFALLMAVGAEFGPRGPAPIRVTETVVVINGVGAALAPPFPLETARVGDSHVHAAFALDPGVRVAVWRRGRGGGVVAALAAHCGDRP